MLLPPRQEFRPEAESGRWVASSEQGDYDLAVPGDAGGPQEAALELLEDAEGDQAKLFEHARHHVAAFCQAPEYGLANDPTMVELEITRCRGNPVANVTFNFESDVYGLWSVAFSKVAPGKWVPVSFGRTNW